MRYSTLDLSLSILLYTVSNVVSLLINLFFLDVVNSKKPKMREAIAPIP